jgi:hypothetical protein
VEALAVAVRGPERGGLVLTSLQLQGTLRNAAVEEGVVPGGGGKASGRPCHGAQNAGHEGSVIIDKIRSAQP